MFHCKRLLFLSLLVFVIKQSSQSPLGSKVEAENVDLNVDLSCVSNSTCIKSVSKKIVRALSSRKVIDFGAFTIEPVKNAKKIEGRSMSKLWDFANNNALRVPLGSYSLALQRSEEYDNYLEVSISKNTEGKQHFQPTKINTKVCQTSFLSDRRIGERENVILLNFHEFHSPKISIRLKALE